MIHQPPIFRLEGIPVVLCRTGAVRSKNVEANENEKISDRKHYR